MLTPTVPYIRRQDCEGICSLWLEFETGAKKYVVNGAYHEWQRLCGKEQRTFEAQKKKWTRFVNQLYKHVIKGAGMSFSKAVGVTWTSGCDVLTSTSVINLKGS